MTELVLVARHRAHEEFGDGDGLRLGQTWLDAPLLLICFVLDARNRSTYAFRVALWCGCSGWAPHRAQAESPAQGHSQRAGPRAPPLNFWGFSHGLRLAKWELTPASIFGNPTQLFQHFALLTHR